MNFLHSWRMNQFMSNLETQSVRRRWRISGRVQGVGFRPSVYRAAEKLHVTGSVANDASGVIVEGQGTPRQLDDFALAMKTEIPAAAMVRQMIEEPIPPRPSETRFTIALSVCSCAPNAEVTADLAVCPQCLADIHNAGDSRRHRYALTNCTNCGPRLSIIRAVPYDRQNTTMSAFAMCDDCRHEYQDAADRRFHAEPNACRLCGPRLELDDSRGHAIEGDPIRETARALAEEKIVAIKGIGGFHLAVRADCETAVARLRALKHRPAKPFALMCASLDAAGRCIEFTQRGLQLITSAAAPIVLGRRVAASQVAPSVAPASHRLGVMLAYTPLHHLLFDDLRKYGIDCLVMTSGNDVEEPLVYDDREAVERLGEMCDLILRHNRPIERAVDDSVVIDAASGPIFVRRSRGYVPEPIALAGMKGLPPGLALGAEMKCAVATCRDGNVVLSQHLGNLTQARTFDAFKHSIADLCRLFAVEPRWIAHDLHPAYMSTQHAAKLAAESGVPLIAVQHHHAHAAGVLAEHGLTGPALAVVCDGTGYGNDGTIWGGEVMVAHLDHFQRLARLRPMLLPGGDACAKQPWRSALALLFSSCGEFFTKTAITKTLCAPAPLEFIRHMLVFGTSCVPSSSTGRLFDGVAALLGVCRENHFDAEAPAALEAQAASYHGKLKEEDCFRLRRVDGLLEIDLSHFVHQLAFGLYGHRQANELAMIFHDQLAAGFAAAVASAMHVTGLKTVVLSGGVFCNELFDELLGRKLEALGAQVLRHRRIPPNDGGIAFGQAVVACAQLRKGAVQLTR